MPDRSLSLDPPSAIVDGRFVTANRWWVPEDGARAIATALATERRIQERARADLPEDGWKVGCIATQLAFRTHALRVIAESEAREAALVREMGGRNA